MDEKLRSRSAALRAMRACTDLRQAEVMAETGLSQSTLSAAEKGYEMSDKTWRRLCEVYAARGVEWREGRPGLMVVVG